MKKNYKNKEIINMKENNNYKIYESNYDKYILINGKNMEQTAQAIE